LQKRKVLSLKLKSEGVMDDESGESMELVEEVPLKEQLGQKSSTPFCHYFGTHLQKFHERF